MKKVLKKVLIVFLLLICFIEGLFILKLQKDKFALKEELYKTSDTKEEKHQIDIELEKCMEQDYSTSNMNNCTYKAQEKWEKEILKNSHELKKLLDKDQQKLFAEAQKSWEEYYKKEQKFIFKVIFNIQGTIHSNYATGASENLAQQRAKDIEGYIFYIEN